MGLEPVLYQQEMGDAEKFLCPRAPQGPTQGYIQSLSLLPVTSVSSVAQLCLTLCDPMDGSTPSVPIHHQLPELTQTYVHRVGDAIQPSHPLSSPSPLAFNLSQHQGLFK